MLCDVTTTQGGQMPFQEYPHGQIGFAWPVWSGVDFASVPEAGARMKNRSHTAISHMTKTPNGQGVVRGGEFGQWTQGQTEEAMLRTQNRFPNFQVMALEVTGKGELFFETIVSRNDKLSTLLPAQAGFKSKIQRLYSELAPHLRNGSLMISDEDTAYLRAARDFCRRFPNVPHQNSAMWDVMDYIYWGWKAMNGELLSPHSNGSGPKKHENPFKLMAASR